MSELSSKLKALKFMQRKESATSTSGTTASPPSVHEENKAKLSASVRWFLENPVSKPEIKRNFKVTYEQSGGQNRIGHSTFNDYKKRTTVGDENPEDEVKGFEGEKEPQSKSASAKVQPSPQQKSFSAHHSVAKSQSPHFPQPKYYGNEEHKDHSGYKYSKHQQKSSPPSSSNRRNSMESEQYQNQRQTNRQHHNTQISAHHQRHHNESEEDHLSNRRRPYNK
jgi:hypothetical protein